MNNPLYPLCPLSLNELFYIINYDYEKIVNYLEDLEESSGPCSDLAQ